MPSSWDPEVSSWATLAKGFASGEGCMVGIVKDVLFERKAVLRSFAV